MAVYASNASNARLIANRSWDRVLMREKIYPVPSDCQGYCNSQECWYRPLSLGHHYSYIIAIGNQEESVILLGSYIGRQVGLLSGDKQPIIIGSGPVLLIPLLVENIGVLMMEYHWYIATYACVCRTIVDTDILSKWLPLIPLITIEIPFTIDIL